MWRMVLGAALLYALRVVVLAKAEAGMGRISPAVNLSDLLATLSLVAEVLVVVLVVQKDAVAGLRQDWLVRPVQRTDLLLGKLTFVVLLVQGPVFVWDTMAGLAAGIGPGAVMGAALWRSVWMLGALLIPVLAFATLTRNLMEAVGAGLGVALAFASFQSVMLDTGATFVAASGIGWILSSMQMAWLLVGGAVILALQYYGRKVVTARWVGGLALALTIGMQFLPWQQAFAIQEILSRKPSAAKGIQIVFEQGSRTRAYGTGDNRMTVSIPVLFHGVGPDQRLISDRVSARLMEANGEVTSLNPQWEKRTVSPSGSFDAGLLMTKDMVGRLRRHSAKLEVEFYLTLVQAGAERTMSADGSASFDRLGSCQARTNFMASQVEVNCRVPGKAPCAFWQLQEATGLVRVYNFNCPGDYAPRPMDTGSGAIASFRENLSFEFGRKIGDPAVAAEDAQKLKGAQLRVRTYQPVDHFTRQLVIPDFSLNQQ